MQSLLEIEGIDPPLAELIEAAGFLDATVFKANDAETIHTELVRANDVLSLVNEVPAQTLINSWIQQLSENPDNSANDSSPKELQLEEEKKVSKYAIPISAEFIQLNNIDIDELPQISAPEAIQSSTTTIPRKEGKSVAVHKPAKQAVDRSKVKSLDDFRTHGSSVAPLERPSDDSNVRAPKDSTNAGVDPNSKSYVRGVLHRDGGLTYWGAIAFLMTLVLLAISALPVIYIVVMRENFYLGFLSPVILIVALFVYVLFARKSSCPVCRQRQFVPKACNKHVKAHGSRLLGHMIPTALHLIRYKWFRCIFCGTAIRLKE